MDPEQGSATSRGQGPIVLRCKSALLLKLFLILSFGEANGRVLTCWGEDHSNQLNVPAFLQEERIKDLAIGDGFACGLFKNSTGSDELADLSSSSNWYIGDQTYISCWGNWMSGFSPPADPDFWEVKAGLRFACAAKFQPGSSVDMDLVCWGDSTDDKTTVPGPYAVVAWDLGDDHGCLVENTGGVSSVHCWGSDGLNKATPPALTNPVRVMLGTAFSCAQDDTGLVCWGQDGGVANVPNVGGHAWSLSSMQAAGRHACTVTYDEDPNPAYCWGSINDNTVAPEFGVRQFIVAAWFNCWVWDNYNQASCNGVAKEMPPGRVGKMGSSRSALWAGQGMACALMVTSTSTTTTASTSTTRTSVTRTSVTRTSVSSTTSTSGTSTSSSTTSGTTTTKSSSTTATTVTETSVTASSTSSSITGSTSSTSSSASSTASSSSSRTSTGTISPIATATTSSLTSTGTFSTTLASSRPASTAGTFSTTLASSRPASTATSAATITTAGTTQDSFSSGRDTPTTDGGRTVRTTDATTSTITDKGTAAVRGTDATSTTTTDTEATSAGSTNAFGTESSATESTSRPVEASSSKTTATSAVAGELRSTETPGFATTAIGTDPSAPGTPAAEGRSSTFLSGSPVASNLPPQTATSTSAAAATDLGASPAVGFPSEASGEVGLLQTEEKQSAELVATLASSHGGDLSRALPDGGLLFGAKLGRALATSQGGPQAVKLPSGLEVFVPWEALPEENEKLALVVALPGEEHRALERENLAAAAVLNFRTLRGNMRMPIRGLAKPIRFSLPVNYSEGMRCAFWDEGATPPIWSLEGVDTPSDNTPGERLWCETTHLSLFGALLKGAVDALLCANHGLFSLAALKELLGAGWYFQRGSLVFFALLLLLLSCGLAAAILDRRRNRSLLWREEFFLASAETPTEMLRSQGSAEWGSMGSDSGGIDSGHGSAQTLMSAHRVLPVMAFSSICCGCSCCAMAQDRSRAVICDALHDIFSSWFAYFGEVRTVLEEMLNGLGPDGAALTAGMGLARCGDLQKKATGAAVMLASRKAAAAALALSGDTVKVIMQDQALLGFLAARAESHYLENGVSLGSGSSSSLGSTRPRQRQAWFSLRNEVLDELMRQTRLQKQETGLMAAWRTFACQSPVGGLFVFDIFRSCKERVLLLAAELLGALAFCCLFFETTGAKGTSCNEAKAAAGFAEGLGRFMVLALGSLVLAGAPCAFLRSLQTKRFTMLACAPGAGEWEKRLKVWRIQGIIYWCFGGCYVAVCGTFVAVFLANAGDADHGDWSTTGVLALLQELVLLPFLTAVLVPLAARALVLLQVALASASKEQVLSEACQSLYRRLALPVEDI